MKRARLIVGVFAAALCLRIPLYAQESVLENDFIRVVISNATAAITSLTNKTTQESYELSQVPFILVTDRGTVSAEGKTPAKSSNGKETCAFTFEADGLSVDLRYSLLPGQRFLQKWLVVRSADGKDFALKEIVLESHRLDPPLKNAIKYYSYAGRGGLTPHSRGCPTALFLRSKEGGLFLGIENPFFSMEAGEEGVKLSYPPMLKIKSNEEYESEKEFLGAYRKTGLFYAKQLPKLSGWAPDRFDGIWESMSHDVLDWGEIWAMQEVMRACMPPTSSKFPAMMDGWWAQLPSLPAEPSRADVEFTCRMAANLRKIGVNLMGLMAFPKEPARLPELASMGWEMNSNVEEVIEREQANGMRFGLYLGEASAMGPFGNSGPRNFLPEKEGWKKKDRDARGMAVNCMGCDEFADWFLKVQDSTIRRYELGWWQWDGGLGSWDICHAENHRHLPGENAYAEWRGRMEVIRRLKEAHPDLWIHIYWGLKPYGPWGLKWVDTHENYYEMGEPRVFPTISSDHWMADDGRLQFWWNQNCRFLPHYKNYAQVGHAAYGPGTEGSAAEIEKGEFWEDNSWKYALLSVIGTSGSAAINTFPNDLDAIHSKDFVEFYRKWLAWANENVEYLKVSRGIFGPPEIGSVDGYSHVLGDRGFVFLFNPNQREINIALPLDEKIMLIAGRKFTLTELYPQEGRCLIWGGAGVFPLGAEVVITVPPEDVVVVQIRPYREKPPMLFGVPGKAVREGDELVVTGVRGEEGSVAQLLVLDDEPRRIKRLTINDQEVRFGVTEKGYVRTVVQFEGVRIIREMDNWGVEKGGRIEIPNERELKEVILRTTFYLPGKVKDILEARKPHPRPSGKPTPLTADASRLLVSIPLTFPDCVASIKAKINDRAVPVHEAGLGRFIDITEEVLYDKGNSLRLEISELLPGQFLGPYIENIPVQTTDRFKGLSEDTRTLTKIGLPPQKPFCDAEAFAEIRKRTEWAAEIRAKMIESYHHVHNRNGIPHRIEFATLDRRDEDWGSENLMDDDTGQKGGSWLVATEGPAEAIIGFEGKPVTIRGVRLFNNSSDPPAGLTKDFAIYVTNDDGARRNPKHPSWKLIFKGCLEPQSESFQEFAFPPEKAKYVRLQLINNHAGSTIGAAELEFLFK